MSLRDWVPLPAFHDRTERTQRERPRLTGMVGSGEPCGREVVT